MDAPRRVGIMGGTFDPIHNGHLVAGSEVADRFNLDVVVFVPTGQPWQKKGSDVSPAEDRYLMTVIATASNPRFLVSRADIDRAGDTFTVDTLRDMREEFPGADLFFITGADALEKIITWRDWESMFDLAHFVGVTRPGYELPMAGSGAGSAVGAEAGSGAGAGSGPGADDDAGTAPAADLGPLQREVDAGRLSLVSIPAMAISSTDIRHRAAHGRPVWYLVPEGVVQYITKHGMYLR